jgi:hypothetical protein
MIPHMLPFRFRNLLLSALAAAAPAFSKGIQVRFLAVAPGDSAVRYDVYRQAAGDSARRIGSVNAGGTDTVAFPDTGAKRGSAYRYSMRAVDGAGRESDPSDSTLAAIPLLALPDTLRAASWPVSWTLPASAHPLRGAASLALELSQPADPSVSQPAAATVALAYDTAAGRIEFRLASGHIGTLRIALRGSYFGKFADADTAVIVAEGAPVSLAIPREAAAGSALPAFGRARNVDGRGLPVLVTRRGGSRGLYDAAGRNAGKR